MADQPSIPRPLQINPLPGVRRDGTDFDADYWNDTQWVRFQRKRARKIGGYQALTPSLQGIARTINLFSRTGQTYFACGSANLLEQFTVDTTGAVTVPADRTPTASFSTNVNNLWQFDVQYDSILGNAALLCAHVAPNLTDIDSAAAGRIYTGDATLLTTLSAVSASTASQVSGGICVLPPYLIAFGSNGYWAWSVPNSPTDFAGSGSGSGYITDQKIVVGKLARGGSGASPSGLFWSLNALIRASFVGGATTWQFDTISDDITILSSRCVVEYDGVFFWPGVDRFLSFNGVVREVPNDMNQNYFFDNLNYAQRQKVFGFKNTRYGEIWWCYPRGTATECTHAIILNLRENTWYDTQLPNSGRAGAVAPQIFRYPVMTGVDANPITNRYVAWQHEYGTDEVSGTTVNPIRAYCETCDYSFVGQDQNAIDAEFEVSRMEPDFVQSGDMTITVRGKANARSSVWSSDTKTLPATATSAFFQTLPFHDSRKQMRFRFESNTIGGDFQQGKILVFVRPGGSRFTG